MTERTKQNGLTLVELMVAIAVVSILMSGIIALFVGSMRAVRQGHHNMEAFAVARGALEVIERDLRTCFTSRQYGDYYTFFGMPTGMAFVGITRTTSGQGDMNLARLSYVLHEYVPDHLRPANITPEEAVVFGRSFDTRMFVGGEEVDVRVYTRALLRYVEPIVKDLSDFPFKG
ncbi:MAG TPA: type II secretion system protein, partial [Candidatus Hydrogenedentes bacterium]|nr:type II secretion system protein [Candidatus Hydrogenedentota bacterium]